MLQQQAPTHQQLLMDKMGLKEVYISIWALSSGVSRHVGFNWTMDTLSIVAKGHSAIGFGRYSSNPASADQFGIGVIYGEVIEGMYTNLNGGSFTKGTLGNLYAAIIF